MLNFLTATLWLLGSLIWSSSIFYKTDDVGRYEWRKLSAFMCVVSFALYVLYLIWGIDAWLEIKNAEYVDINYE